MAAALWASPTTGTDPQDVAGVHLGMTVAEALAAMGGSVQTVQMEVSSNSLGNQMFWDERGVTLLTCKGRVTSVSVNVSGEFHDLAAVLKQDIAKRGPVSVVVDNAEAGSDILSSLSAKWPTSDNATYVVTYTVMEHSPPTISRAVNVNENCRL
jgi:hypothetical protein